jgi:hypothetical protein
MDSKSSCRRQITQRSCQPENKVVWPSRSATYAYRSKRRDHRIAPLPGHRRPVFGTNMECADMSALLKAATRRHTPKSEIVGHVDPVDLETLHGIHEGRRGIFCEPGGRTPFVFFRERNDAVLRWIIMNIIQPGQIRALEGDVALPKLKPHFSSRLIVPAVELFGRLHVKFTKKFPQRARMRW